MERFSKENINKLLYVPHPVTSFQWNFIHHVLGPIIDFSPVIALFFWIIAGNLIYIDVSLFVVIFMFLLFLNIVFFYFIFIKYYRFKVNSYKIKIDNLKEPDSFVFVSDIHFGTEFPSTNIFRLRRLINKINSLNSNLVIFGGDFLSHSFTIKEKKMMEVFKNLKAETKIGVYGNHDSEYLEDKQYEQPKEFLAEVEKNGIKILINNSMAVSLNGQDFCFGGLPDLYSKEFNIVETFKNCP